ncbi:MAG TPA: SAM-dependent methyltransferase [Candidatus Limnocylindria bacterium]
MGCCRPGDLDDVFGEERATADARTYRRRGLDREARAIVEALRDRVTGWTVLEAGGGVGAIQLELLRAGAARATNVELASGYEPSALELITEAGVADRVARLIGDFVSEAPALEDADVVILHRVVCCYPDADAMMRAAARRARRMLLVTVPVDRWWTRLGVRILDIPLALRRSKLRVRVHPNAVLRAAAEREGLRVVSRRGRFAWQLFTFARS